MEIKSAECPLGAKCEEVKEVDGKQVLYRCPWFVQVRGRDPNNGTEIDHWGCAIAWMPTLLINTANETRQGAAATESFRNEMMKQGETTHKVMLLAAQITNGKRDRSLLEQKEICE